MIPTLLRDLLGSSASNLGDEELDYDENMEDLEVYPTGSLGEEEGGEWWGVEVWEGGERIRGARRGRGQCSSHTPVNNGRLCHLACMRTCTYTRNTVGLEIFAIENFRSFTI